MAAQWIPSQDYQAKTEPPLPRIRLFHDLQGKQSSGPTGRHHVGGTTKGSELPGDSQPFCAAAMDVPREAQPRGLHLPIASYWCWAFPSLSSLYSSYTLWLGIGRPSLPIVWYDCFLRDPKVKPDICRHLIFYLFIYFYKEAKTIQWKREGIFSKCCWSIWMSACRQMQIDPYLSPCTKVKYKRIKDLNITRYTKYNRTESVE